MKRYLGVMIFGGIEIVSFFWFNIKDLDTFFFLWTFISIILGGFLLFGGPIGHGPGPKGSASPMAALRVAIDEKNRDDEDRRKGRNQEKEMQRLFPYLVMGLYTILNIVGLILATVDKI